MEIRALTLHFSPSSWEGPILSKEIDDNITLLYEVRDHIREVTGLDVWSLRLSFPWFPSDADAERLVNILDKYIDDIYIAGFILSSRSKAIEKLNHALSNGIFSSIILEDLTDIPGIVDFVIKISGEDPLNATRLGIELTGAPLVTPYFPLSRHEGVSKRFFTMALLYTDEVYRSKDMVEFKTKLIEVINKVKPILKDNIDGVPVRGIDYSLSPWMEHSSAKVVEDLGSCNLGEPGCHYSIYIINKILAEVASSFSGIGFNEVMLPLAEDDVMKKRVVEGGLSIKDLLSYSSVCLVGPDMIPLRTDREDLIKLYTDTYAIAMRKGRPTGIRIIPLSRDYTEDFIDLGMFGRTPVLSL